MSEQEEDRIRKNAVRYRFRLGGLSAQDILEVQNFLASAAKKLVPPALARHTNGVKPIPPEREAELRKRFGIPQPQEGAK